MITDKQWQVFEETAEIFEDTLNRIMNDLDDWNTQPDWGGYFGNIHAVIPNTDIELEVKIHLDPIYLRKDSLTTEAQKKVIDDADDLEANRSSMRVYAEKVNREILRSYPLPNNMSFETYMIVLRNHLLKQYNPIS